jgi:hypothetical protein
MAGEGFLLYRGKFFIVILNLIKKTLILLRAGDILPEEVNSNA